MTDQELAQEIADRLNAAESAAEAAGDGRRLAVLHKAHRELDKAWRRLMPELELSPLSGGGPKPPEAP